MGRQALAVAAVVLATAGCVIGDSGVSRQDFAKRADAICSTFERRISLIPRPQSIRELAVYVDRALPIARQQIAQLRKLERPEGDGDRIEQMLEALDREVKEVDALRGAARRENQAQVQAVLARSAVASTAAGRIANELELTVCAKRN